MKYICLFIIVFFSCESDAESIVISYVNTINITKLDLENPELVSVYNLHPSESAYKLFTESILLFVK